MLPLPISPYAVAKLAGEGYCRSFHAVFGLETVSLRYFNVFGPRQDPLSQYAAVIPNFTTALLTGERPSVFGDGEQSRDFTYVDNVVAGNLLAMTADGVGGKVYNVSAGERLAERPPVQAPRADRQRHGGAARRGAAGGGAPLPGRHLARPRGARLPARCVDRGGPSPHRGVVQGLVVTARGRTYRLLVSAATVM